MSTTIEKTTREKLEQLQKLRKSADLADARATIQNAREAARKRDADTTLQAARTDNAGQEQKLPFETEEDPASIIPYEIIATITQFDNIYETRLFGWCMAKAQAVLKLYNKDLSEINLQHALDVTRVTLPARYLLNPGDKNYSNIEKAFTLATKQINYEKNGRRYWLNIIAFPELRKTQTGKIEATFLLHREVWHALLDFSHGHRLFNLPTYIRLTSKYAVIMYLIVSQQNAAPKSYGTAKLKQILGCDKLKGYDRGNNFVQKVLAPARAELLEKAPYYFDYSLTKTGSAGKITEVVIISRPNLQYKPTDDQTARKCKELRLRLDPTVKDYCVQSFGIKLRPLEKLETLIIALGSVDNQMAKLAEIKAAINSRRVKNPAGYFTRAIKNTGTT